MATQSKDQSIENEWSSDEQEERERMIQQILELQNTLDDLTQRVDSVKEENLKLKSENQVLGQYIENLMSASSVFLSTSPKNKRKSKKWSLNLLTKRSLFIATRRDFRVLNQISSNFLNHHHYKHRTILLTFRVSSIPSFLTTLHW